MIRDYCMIKHTITRSWHTFPQSISKESAWSFPSFRYRGYFSPTVDFFVIIHTMLPEGRKILTTYKTERTCWLSSCMCFRHMFIEKGFVLCEEVTLRTFKKFRFHFLFRMLYHIRFFLRVCPFSPLHLI